MKVCVLHSSGIMEITAKVLIELVLEKVEFVEVGEPADVVICLSRSYDTNNFDKDVKVIKVFKAGSEETYLSRVFETCLSDTFKGVTLSHKYLRNIEYFIEMFSKTESSDLISELVILFMENEIDLQSLSKDELITCLKESVEFNKQVDELTGVKLHLYANHNKLDPYYRWLSFKFKTLNFHKKKRCGKSFFTESEIESFYRSLCSKLCYVSDILNSTEIEVVERDLGDGKSDFVYILYVSSLNRALNEVILKCYGGGDQQITVCSIANSSAALYSKYEGSHISHVVVSNKNKIERICEYV